MNFHNSYKLYMVDKSLPMEQRAQKCPWCCRYLLFDDLLTVYNGKDTRYQGWLVHEECVPDSPKSLKQLEENKLIEQLEKLEKLCETDALESPYLSDGDMDHVEEMEEYLTGSDHDHSRKRMFHQPSDHGWKVVWVDQTPSAPKIRLRRLKK